MGVRREFLIIYYKCFGKNNKVMKQSLREYYEKEKKLCEKPNRVKCFFSALDSKLEGNKLYDWYWWNIWANATRPYAKLVDWKHQHKYNKQRIKSGISEQDCWSIPDWLLDTMYNGLQNFLNGEYGSTVYSSVDWDNHICDTHDKKLFKSITNYLEDYRRLWFIRQRLEKFDPGNDPKEVWYPEYNEIQELEYDAYKTCIKSLTKLLSKYLEVLWW